MLMILNESVQNVLRGWCKLYRVKELEMGEQKSAVLRYFLLMAKPIALDSCIK